VRHGNHRAALRPSRKAHLNPERMTVDGVTVRLRPSHLLPPGVDALTLPRVVLVRHGLQPSASLLTHEAEHLRQWRRHGVLGFLFRYLGDYLRGRRSGLDHHRAYLQIGFEQDARATAARLDGESRN